MNVTRSLGSQWIATIYIGAVSMLLAVIIARELGPLQFGKYSYVLNLVSIYAIIQDGGFKTLLFREGTKQSTLFIKYNDHIAQIGIGHVTLTTFIGILLVLIVSFPNKLPLISGIICFGFITVSNFITSILKGKGQFEVSAAWQSLNRTITAISIILAIIYDLKNVSAIFIFWTLGTCISLTLPFGREIWKIPEFKLKLKHYSSCASFMIIDISTVIYFRCDIILLKYLKCNEEVIGQYAASYRLLEGLIMLITPLAHICFRYLRLSWNKQHEFIYLFKKMFISMIGLAAVIYIIGIITAKSIVLFIYGQNFKEASDLTIVLLGAMLFILPNYILTQAVIAKNKEKLYAAISVFTAFVNIIINFILIPKFGAKGAAYSTIITEGVLFLSMYMIYFLSIRPT